MEEFIKNILVYVIIVSMLKGLVTNPKYRQYFQFLSGLIMIMLMLTPILSLFDGENRWYMTLEKRLLQMDLTEVEEQMKIADGTFEEAVEKRYRQTVAAQVKTLAKEKKVEVKEADVTLKKDSNAWTIQEITLVTKKDTESDLSVEAVRMETDCEVKKEDTSRKARSLRRQICDHFVLGEDKVHIWK